METEKVAEPVKVETKKVAEPVKVESEAKKEVQALKPSSSSGLYFAAVCGLAAIAGAGYFYMKNKN